MKERRGSLRYNCLVEIKYRAIDGSIKGYCFTKDLSKGGVNLPLDRYIEPYQRFVLEIQLPDAKEIIIATALVAWTQKNRFHWEPVYSAGLKFEKLDAKSVERIVNFANSHQWQKSAFEKALEANAVPIIE